MNGVLKGMDESDWKLVAFAIETGLRREEQFRLKWDQVDLKNGVLTLPLPKGGKTRHVPLSDEAKTILGSFDSFLRSAWDFMDFVTLFTQWTAGPSFGDHLNLAYGKLGLPGCVGIHFVTPRQVDG
jgi:integrase